MGKFTVQEVFDHHKAYHLSGMTAPWCAFCPQSSLPSGERKGEVVQGKGTLTAAELRTSGRSGVRSIA